MAKTPPDSPAVSVRDRQMALTLAEHLPPGYTADLVEEGTEHSAEASRHPSSTASPSESRSSPTAEATAGKPDEVSSLTLQGGDVHRSLFRLAEAPARRQILQELPERPASPSLLVASSSQQPRVHHRRAATVHGTYGTADADGVRDLLAPQGFRRDFLLQRRQQKRLAEVQRRRTLLHARRMTSIGAARMPIARNFVEFLELYGHFADEDLEEDDDEEAVGEEEEEEEEEQEGERDVERQPLLPGRSESGSAKAGLAQAFFTLLKAFVGTGIMFLPKAFNNGGLVFSAVTLLVVSLLSMAGFRLLLQCRAHVGGGAGYGDIGLAIAGPRMRSLVLGSIALSQLGFVCAGIVFSAENLASFAAAVAASHGWTETVSTAGLIGLQVLVLVPLAFVRDIARLGPAALLGDVFIGIGLVYIYSYDIAAVAARGWRLHPTVQPWFNPAGYTLTVGAAIFTFEGIGLILPIQSSMAQPQRFGLLLNLVMALITGLYLSVGVLCYAAFGAYTKTEVIDNYPRDSPLVQAVQCIYALAVIAGLPVQLFPAVRIIEGHLFGGPAGRFRSGKRDPRVKWAKNALRTALAVACGAVAALGTGSLDRFVALIGSLTCVPLLFIYPPYLHYRAIANSWLSRALDVSLMSVGFVAMVYTTTVTVANAL